MVFSKASRKYANPLLLLSLFVSAISYFWPQILEIEAEQSEPHYSVRILSYDPLLMHLEGSISKLERTYLMNLGKDDYTRSRINGINSTGVESDERTSDTAWLPRHDPIVERIISRASKLQGYTPLEYHEPLQLTRYKAGQRYTAHWDHYHGEPVPANESQRMTTIFAILDASCDECGTKFPLLSVDWSKEDPQWCQFVDCNQKEITFRPIPGNAFFWKNLNASHQGDYRTLHAGLPPLNGTKIGLNIWTHVEAMEF